MTITDIELNARYELGINRLILENDRIKLPKLIENIRLNPKYMMIDSNWLSSWDEVTKSRLIESLLINIPVMPIIVFEREYNSYELIDGRERLKTVVDFYNDCFELADLEVETNLAGCKYSTLPAQAKDKLNNRSLNLINCIPTNDNQSELEIKKLINTVKKRYG